MKYNNRLRDYHERYWREQKEYSSTQSDVYCRHLTLSYMLHNIKLAKSSNILDLGCGEGETVRLLLEYGYYVTGIDISSNILTEATFLKHDLSLHQLPFDTESLELVVCLEVFEHLFHRRI